MLRRSGAVPCRGAARRPRTSSICSRRSLRSAAGSSPATRKPGAAPVMILGYDLWQNRVSAPIRASSDAAIASATRRARSSASRRAGSGFPATTATDVDLADDDAGTGAGAAEERMDVCGRPAQDRRHARRSARRELAALSPSSSRSIRRRIRARSTIALSLRDALVGDTKWPLLLLQGAVGPRAADRLRERRQPADRARARAPSGDVRARGARRRPRAAGGAAADRNASPLPRRRRRSVWRWRTGRAGARRAHAALVSWSQALPRRGSTPAF